MYRDQFLPIINPATGEKLGTVPVVSREEVPKAVRVGRKAFTGWCQVPLAERLAALGRLRQCITDNIDVIVDKICINTGKTRMDALTAEILSTVDIIKFYEQHTPVFLSKQRLRPHGCSGARNPRRIQTHGSGCGYCSLELSIQSGCVPAILLWLRVIR